jgi:hypothetical protein
MEDDVSERRGGGFGGGCLKGVLALVIVLAAIGAGFWYLGDNIRSRLFGAPDPVTVANASLKGLREQSRLSTFAGSYVAVVTSKETRFGLSAQKTMIMPGTVRYEVDLSRLQQKDLSWNAGTNTLTLMLPPVEVVGPDVDVEKIQEYGAGGILMSLTNAEAQLDTANRKAAQQELLNQASSPLNMRMARAATRRAVENSFALPLRAAGLNATVVVNFTDEPKDDGERMDRSRRPEDVLRNTQ